MIYYKPVQRIFLRAGFFVFQLPQLAAAALVEKALVAESNPATVIADINLLSLQNIAAMVRDTLDNVMGVT